MGVAALIDSVCVCMWLCDACGCGCVVVGAIVWVCVGMIVWV